MKMRGRPKKLVSHDPEMVKLYVERLFHILGEIKTLQEAKKELKEEYEDQVDMKLVASIIRLVKAEMKIDSSPETVSEISDIIKDKINMVM